MKPIRVSIIETKQSYWSKSDREIQKRKKTGGEADIKSAQRG